MTTIELDARNLLCPLPVIKTQNKIKTLQTGDILKVLCTDPGAINDIPCWCRMYGHPVVAIEEDPPTIIITVEVNHLDGST